jgi:hypothetical protein
MLDLSLLRLVFHQAFRPLEFGFRLRFGTRHNFFGALALQFGEDFSPLADGLVSGDAKDRRSPPTRSSGRASGRTGTRYLLKMFSYKGG